MQKSGNQQRGLWEGNQQVFNKRGFYKVKSQRMDSKIEYRGYCETCRAEFIAENPAKACPVCAVKRKRKSKTNKKKGSGKND